MPPEDLKLIHSKDPARVTESNPDRDGVLLPLAAAHGALCPDARSTRRRGRYDALAEQVNAAFQKRFLNPATGVYDNGTQTSSVLPLFFSMAPAENRAALLGQSGQQHRAETNGHVGTGLVGAQFLMRTLTENGRADLAYQIATQPTYPGWGYMVAKGATTVWELWNGDTADPAMNSGNHVMQIGDLGVWMYEYLAGIRPDAANPGFRHILIHPYPAGDLTFVGVARIDVRQDRHLLEARRRRHSRLAVTIPPTRPRRCGCRPRTPHPSPNPAAPFPPPRASNSCAPSPIPPCSRSNPAITRSAPRCSGEMPTKVLAFWWLRPKQHRPQNSVADLAIQMLPLRRGRVAPPPNGTATAPASTSTLAS